MFNKFKLQMVGILLVRGLLCGFDEFNLKRGTTTRINHETRLKTRRFLKLTTFDSLDIRWKSKSERMSSAYFDQMPPKATFI